MTSDQGGQLLQKVDQLQQLGEALGRVSGGCLFWAEVLAGLLVVCIFFLAVLSLKR